MAFYAGLAQAAALGLLRHVQHGRHDAWTQEGLNDSLSSEAMRHAHRKDELNDIVLGEQGTVQQLKEMFSERPIEPRALAGDDGPRPAAGKPTANQSKASKVQRRITTPWKQEMEDRFRRRYQREDTTLQRLDSTQGRKAAGYLTCLPRTDALTFNDADYFMNTRLRLGVPPAPNLPTVCICSEPPVLSLQI